MTTYNTVIKKRNATNNGWDSILPITTAVNVLIDEQGNTVATHLAESATENVHGLGSHVGHGGSEHAEATTSVSGFMSAEDKSKLNRVVTPEFVEVNVPTSPDTITASEWTLWDVSAYIPPNSIVIFTYGHSDSITVQGGLRPAGSSWEPAVKFGHQSSYNYRDVAMGRVDANGKCEIYTSSNRSSKPMLYNIYAYFKFT